MFRTFDFRMSRVPEHCLTHKLQAIEAANVVKPFSKPSSLLFYHRSSADVTSLPCQPVLSHLFDVTVSRFGCDLRRHHKDIFTRSLM